MQSQTKNNNIKNIKNMGTRDIQNALNAINFSDCKEKEDMCEKIREVLQYEFMAANDEEAEQQFSEYYDTPDFSKDKVHHNVIWTGIANVDDVDYKAIVKEHYFDAGSVDYVYSFDIVRI